MNGKSKINLFLAIVAVAALVIPMIVVNAQAPASAQAPAATATPAAGRGDGRGGGRGAAATNVPAPTSPVTGNAVTGKVLYYNYSCYGCHGYNGETGRAFVGSWGNLQTEAGFIAFLRLRGENNPASPSTSMPNFPLKTLSDVQAKDIYAYIRTFRSNAPELKDIPALNAIVAAASKPYKK